MKTTINHKIASQIIRREFRERGIQNQSVNDLVRGLIMPSLYGIDTHGLRLLPTYLSELDGGRSNAFPAFTFKNRKGGLISLDADGALGVVAGYVAVRCGIELAKRYGISLVNVYNSNHYGAASNYTDFAAKKGFMSFSFSSADALVVAHNGNRAVLGTNPIAFSAPAEVDDFMLDMATSQVSYSKVNDARAKGKDVPKHWVTSNTVDGEESLLPLGGYKGQGLAMMVSIITSSLSGSRSDFELDHFYAEPFDRPRGISHTHIVVDTRCIQNNANFRMSVSRLMAGVASSGDENDCVCVPGQIENKIKKARLADGIPLDVKTRHAFEGLAIKHNIHL